MELALSGIVQMASHNKQRIWLGFQAGSERRGRNSNGGIISLLTRMKEKAG